MHCMIQIPMKIGKIVVLDHFSSMYACFMFCFPLSMLFVMAVNRFASIVKKLKASNYVGSDLLDKLATSERTVRE